MFGLFLGKERGAVLLAAEKLIPVAWLVLYMDVAIVGSALPSTRTPPGPCSLKQCALVNEAPSAWGQPDLRSRNCGLA